MNRRLALRTLLVVSFLTLVLLASPAGAQDVKTPDAHPLGAIEFLVGDWHATAAPPNGKPTEIDNHIYWSETHTAIYFVTRFNGQPHYSGMYAYDPAQKQIAFWYVDTDGNSTQGTARAEGKRIIHDLTNSHANGNQEKLRSFVDPSEDASAYHWQVLREGTTTPLIQLDYKRVK